MLGTHILTHTLFNWLKFTCDPPSLYGSHMIWWDLGIVTNQGECVEKCVLLAFLFQQHNSGRARNSSTKIGCNP